MEDVDGRSRRPEILAAARGEPLDGERPAIAHLDRNWGKRQRDPAPMVAVSDGSFRFVRVAGTDGDVREELFDASADARELRNVAEEQPEVASRMRSLVRGYLEGPPPPWGEEAPALEIDEVQLNQLRALGYSLP